jgi:hypothetical protein
MCSKVTFLRLVFFVKKLFCANSKIQTGDVLLTFKAQIVDTVDDNPQI